MRKTETCDEVNIYADGGSKGNPGPAGIGVVLFSPRGEKIKEISRYIGIATNNVAEYLAVIYGFQEAAYHKAKRVILHIDSQLVARQLKGEYRVKDQNIRKFFDLSSNLLRLFDNVEIREIPRQENKVADVLVNRAINLKALL